MFRSLFSVSILIGFLFLFSGDILSQVPTPTPVQYPTVPNDGHNICISMHPSCEMIAKDDVDVYRKTDSSNQLYFVRGNDINSGDVYLYSQSYLLGTMTESDCFCGPSNSPRQVIAYKSDINPTGIGVNIGTYYNQFYSAIQNKTFVSNLATVAVYTLPKDGAENAGESCGVGEPVNVTNGNMWIKHTDYSLPGVGENIGITRFYNSIGTNAGLFGLGWSTQYDESLGAYGDRMLRLNMPDGRAFYFGRNTLFESFKPISPQFYGYILKNPDNSYTLNFKDGRIHQFSAIGRLLWQRDRNANQTTLTYDTNANLTAVTDAFGRSLNFMPNPNGTIAQISDGLGVMASYEYFPSSNLLKTVTYSDGSKYKLEYIAIGGKMYLQTVKDALDNILETHQYDSSGRAFTSEKQGGTEKYTLDYTHSNDYEPYTTVTDALQRTTNFYFDKTKSRNVITKTEGLCNCGGGSQLMSYQYDDNLNKIKKTDGVGNITTMTYDADGNMLTETDLTGTKTYTYNSFGQVLTLTDQMGGLWVNTYDPNGNLKTATDALTYTTTFVYPTTNNKGLPDSIKDARNKVTKFKWFTASGLLQETEDANLKKTTFTYDARGRTKTTTNALLHTTQFNYFDDTQRKTEMIYPNGDKITYKRDIRQLLESVTDERGKITNYQFDAAYRLKLITDPLGHIREFEYDLMSNKIWQKDGIGNQTDFAYDEFNRLKEVLYPASTIGAIRLKERFEYDNIGRIKKQFDTANRLTEYAYNDVNRIMTVTNAELKQTRYTYNNRLQLVEVKDALNQIYTFTLDALGRVKNQTRAGATMSYEYDEAGNRTKRIDYEGRETFYYYDNLNRLDELSYGSPVGGIRVGDWGADYEYDDISRLTLAENYAGKVTFLYDNRNYVTQTKDVHQQYLNFVYDENGNRTQLKLNNTVHTGYVYDDVNRLTTLTDDANQNFTFGYDVANKLTTKTLPNGIVTSYNYDGMNRLKQLKHQQGSTVLADNNYSYNQANQISQITEPTQTKTFGYDNVDRLTSMTSPTLTSENYSFDEVGNRTSSHLSSFYNYEANNRLSESETHTRLNYDYNGNPSEITRPDSSTSFTWDYENRVVTANNGDEINFEYDALGRRVKRTKGTEITKFTYDGQDVVMDNVNNVITKYQNGLGIDNKLKLKSNGVSKYFLQDHLGSTTALTNSSGSVIESATYDSFGNSTNNLSTRYQFTGREFDTDLGLHYYRARFYDAKLGRFISEDPIGFAGGDVNLFAAVGNNPVNGNDPSGLSGNDFIENINEARFRAEQTIIDHVESPINFVVGFGDNASGGITRSIRKWQGIDNANLDCSLAYQAGEWASIAAQAVSGGVGLYRLGGKFALTAGLRNRSWIKFGYLTGDTIGATSKTGTIIIRRGLGKALTRETIAHELIHRFFTPRSGLFVKARQSLNIWGYESSQLLRATEEGIAEGYAAYRMSGSIRQSLIIGSQYPFVNGYVTVGGVATESGLLIGASSYLGYQAFH
jgi:RHS repeat-associated protein